MPLTKLGQMAVDLEQVSYIEDMTNDPTMNKSNLPHVVIHFNDKRQLICYGNDAAAVQRFIASLPATPPAS